MHQSGSPRRSRLSLKVLRKHRSKPDIFTPATKIFRETLACFTTSLGRTFSCRTRNFHPTLRTIVGGERFCLSPMTFYLQDSSAQMKTRSFGWQKKRDKGLDYLTLSGVYPGVSVEKGIPFWTPAVVGLIRNPCRTTDAHTIHVAITTHLNLTD